MRKKPYPCEVRGWDRKIARGESILPPLKQLPFASPEAGQAGWELFADFRLTTVPGAPHVGDVTGDWLKELVTYWMAAQDPATGHRSVQEMLLLVSKKNTKTTSMALLTLAQFVTTRRRNCQALIIAPTIPVADTAFRTIVGAVETTEGLNRCYKVLPSSREIKDLRNGWHTQLKVAAADLSVLVGTTAQFIMLDEVHVLLEQNGAEFLMEHVRGARVGQPDASCIMCTTHAHEIPSGTWKSELKAYRDIRDGRIDQPRLFVAYEFPDKMVEKGKHLDPENFFVTNPNMGITVDLERMKKDLEFEQAKGPHAESGWRQQFTNLDPKHNNPPNAWSGARYWLDAIDEDPNLGDPSVRGLDALLRRCENVVIGIDGGGMYDLLSLYVIGREAARGRWLGWGHSWAHVGLKDTYPTIWERIKGFVNDGEVSLVDYASVLSPDHPRSINLHQMALLCSYIHSSGLFLPKGSVGIDEMKMGLLADALHDFNLPCPIPYHQVCKVPQGPKMALTADMMGLRVAQGHFLHGNQGLMHWAVNNIIQEPKGNSFIIQKQNLEQDAKIDPAVAMFIAARLFEASPDGIFQINIKRADGRYNRRGTADGSS